VSMSEHVETKYKEIVRLHEMLQEAGIEHDWIDREERMVPKQERKFLRSREFWRDVDFGWQIIVYRDDGERLVSAIEGWGTYGEAEDRIEIKGLLTPEESEGDSVVGWLTAEDVFARIERWRYEHEP